MALFLIHLPHTDKKIYEITKIIGLCITIESLRASGQIGQCFRCQKFGHSQSFCKAEKCVICSGTHRASECKLVKGKDTPHCANCNRDHVVSYRGCPRTLKPKRSEANVRNPQISYAEATKLNTNPQHKKCSPQQAKCSCKLPNY